MKMYYYIYHYYYYIMYYIHVLLYSLLLYKMYFYCYYYYYYNIRCIIIFIVIFIIWRCIIIHWILTPSKMATDGKDLHLEKQVISMKMYYSWDSHCWIIRLQKKVQYPPPPKKKFGSHKRKTRLFMYRLAILPRIN